jgi:hypothetical protein
MSFDLIKKIVLSDTFESSGEKSVMIYLASCVDQEEAKKGQATCHPSLDKIAKYSILSKRTVQNLLAKMEEKGFIARSFKPGRQATVYRINIKALTAARSKKTVAPVTIANPTIAIPTIEESATDSSNSCHSLWQPLPLSIANDDITYIEEQIIEQVIEQVIEHIPPIVPQSDEDELDRKIDEYLAEFETMWLSWDKTIPLEKHLQNILDTTNAPYSLGWCACNAALNRTKAEIRKAFTDSLKERQNAGETLNEWEIHVFNGVEWAVFQYLDPHNQNINRVFEGKNPMEGYEAFQPYYDSAIHKAYKEVKDLWMYRKLRGS